MSQLKEDSLVIEALPYCIEFTNITREKTERSAGCNEGKEWYPAYVWKGDVLIQDRWSGRRFAKKFYTDTFFADSVQGLTFIEIFYLVIRNNYLWKPKILESSKRDLHLYMIRRIILDHLLEDLRDSSSSFAIRPLNVDGRDSLLNRLFTSLSPLK